MTYLHRSMTAPPVPPLWRGWVRRYRSDYWQEVCAGHSYGEVAGELQIHCDGLHADRLVLRADAPNPNLADTR